MTKQPLRASRYIGLCMIIVVDSVAYLGHRRRSWTLSQVAFWNGGGSVDMSMRLYDHSEMLTGCMNRAVSSGEVSIRKYSDQVCVCRAAYHIFGGLRLLHCDHSARYVCSKVFISLPSRTYEGDRLLIRFAEALLTTSWPSDASIPLHTDRIYCVRGLVSVVFLHLKK